MRAKQEFRIRWEGHPDGEEVIRQIAKTTDTVFLAFSAGKDAVGAWLSIRGKFKRIIPFHRYLVPGLEFEERTLRYYEEFFQTRIVRLPHPSLYRMLNALTFQPPERWRLIERLDLPEFDYDDQRILLAEDFGLEPGTEWIANGTRATDSLQRRTHFKCHGAVNHNGRVFYPVWDWTLAGLIDEMQRAKVKLAPDYHIFGRSFDGIDFRFLYPIKKYYPEDYARILEWFPLADMEIQRFEYAKRHATK